MTANFKQSFKAIGLHTPPGWFLEVLILGGLGRAVDRDGWIWPGGIGHEEWQRVANISRGKAGG